MGSLILGNTRPVHGFPGGVHPPEHKSDSNTAPIRGATLPEQVVLPLAQHAGAPAEPVVAVGERVRSGQLVAKARGLVSANIHASISGVVIAIEPRAVQHASGLDQPCIVIAGDGRDEWQRMPLLADWQQREPAELLARIRDAGIAGMGGAGFPTAVKAAPRQKISQLILNAVECEPYITADDRLMRERASDIVEGLKILRHVLAATEVLVGIEDNKPEAIAAMRAASDGQGIDVVVVPTKYPSGGEKQLIQNLTGKEVPSGGLPADVGVVCCNTGTAHAVFRAVVLGEPLVSRIVTLTGAALSQRGNVEARIGTPVLSLLREAGLDETKLHRVVMGGPMMGFTLHSAQVPVVKTTNCLIAATARELPDPAPEQACIRCGACAEACPASLLPQQLYWFSKAGEFAKAQDHHLMDCIECGACAYVCPSSIPLVQYYRFAKGEIRKKQADERKAERAKLRFEARQARIEQEQAEREARRKARAEAAKKRAEAPAEAAPAVAAPAAVDIEAIVKTLKNASLQASADYKAAVKALKDAESQPGSDVTALTRQAEELKARADAAKAAVRAAQQGDLPAELLAAATAAPETAGTDLEQLKHEVGEASSAYKVAVRAAKDAEDSGADNAAELRQHAEQVKQRADELKARLRDAKAGAPVAVAAAETVVVVAQVTPEQMKLLKTSVATSTKQYKEAAAALETAERSGSGDIAAMQVRVAGLKQKADDAKAALEAVVAQMKAAAGKEGS
jgi:electron transport complex protein RnfC